MSLRISNILISSYENSIDSYGIRETWLAYIAKLLSYLRPDVHISDVPTTKCDIDTLSFADDVERCLTYLVLNSSLGYMWWRIYDGGISLTKALMMSIPVPHDGIDIEKAIKAAHDLMKCESEYINVKMNAGKANESVKFPMAIIDANTRILLPKLTDKEYAAIHALHLNHLSEQREAWKVAER